MVSMVVCVPPRRGRRGLSARARALRSAVGTGPPGVVGIGPVLLYRVALDERRLVRAARGVCAGGGPRAGWAPPGREGAGADAAGVSVAPVEAGSTFVGSGLAGSGLAGWGLAGSGLVGSGLVGSSLVAASGVVFLNGSACYDNKSDTYYVLCVRGVP